MSRSSTGLAEDLFLFPMRPHAVSPIARRLAVTSILSRMPAVTVADAVALSLTAKSVTSATGSERALCRRPLVARLALR